MHTVPAITFLAKRIPILISNNPWLMGLGIAIFLGFILYRIAQDS